MIASLSECFLEWLIAATTGLLLAHLVVDPLPYILW